MANLFSHYQTTVIWNKEVALQKLKKCKMFAKDFIINFVVDEYLDRKDLKKLNSLHRNMAINSLKQIGNRNLCMGNTLFKANQRHSHHWIWNCRFKAKTGIYIDCIRSKLIHLQLPRKCF